MDGHDGANGRLSRLFELAQILICLLFRIFICLIHVISFSFVRQKVGNGERNELDFYIMPCGGAVDAEVTLKGEAIISRKQIYGYEIFRVKNPVLGQRFLLRISASKSEELHRISTVEVRTI